MKICKFYFLIILILLTAGCGGQIGINDSLHVRNKSELLEIAGEPHKVKASSKGDEWIYNFSSFNIFNFEKRTYYYRYLVNDNGEIVEQIAIENIYRALNLFGDSPEDWFEKCLNEQGHKFSLDSSALFGISKEVPRSSRAKRLRLAK